MKITPQDINTQEFKRSLRGYDMDEVDAFLTQVADELEARVQENLQLKDQVKVLEDRIAEYRRLDQRLKDTLVTAQEMKEEITKASQHRVEAAAAQARAEAQRIVADAHKQLVRIQAQVDDLKRYRDSFVIRYKAFLDQQYRFLADYAKSEGAGAAPEQSAKTPQKPEPGEKPPAPRRATTAEGGELEIEVTGDGEKEEPVG
ncbi:MAG: DivIVA domain-containing protein [candidate division Zixibacteria bacterium]|nr:DivIVA domain-containing protein [candidate division Zixibacteria bacterium]